MILSPGFSIPDDLLEIDIDDLVGFASMTSPAFDVDGTSEEYEHIFEWDDLSDPIWASENNDYTIHALLDFEPTCVVSRYLGKTIGFYLDGEAWVQDTHRGNGLGPKMIVSAIAATGELPNSQNIGFTDAGMAIHFSAVKILTEMQHANSNKPGI